MTKQIEALTKRERRYLHPAIVFGWRIEIWMHLRDGKGLWDGDSTCPVKVGKMAKSLIERGYLERVGHYIRATAKAKNLKCRNGCSNGYRYDDDGQPTGKCQHCDDGIRREASNV